MVIARALRGAGTGQACALSISRHGLQAGDIGGILLAD